MRGLFSGGTLCYEALVLARPTRSARCTRTRRSTSRYGLPAPAGAHVCLDLGEEEYTRGRPHPMIDPEARIELLRAQGATPDVAVILLDVVLGHGAHADPAGELAPVCAEIIADGGPRVVVYVLGTEQDPQGYDGAAGSAGRRRAAWSPRRPPAPPSPLPRSRCATPISCGGRV